MQEKNANIPILIVSNGKRTQTAFYLAHYFRKGARQSAPLRMKRYQRAALWGLLSLLTLAFIFGNSMQDGEASSDTSDWFVQLAEPIFSITDTDAETGAFVIRKTAHFSEFTLLGTLLTAAACLLPLPAPRLAAAYTGTLAAIADELIQRFVDGRSSQVSDVVIDLCGVLCGIALCSLIRALLARRKRAKSGV